MTNFGNDGRYYPGYVPFYTDRPLIADDDQEERAIAIQQFHARDVKVCAVCGGKYRPAGGPCIHEHPRGRQADSGPVCCLSCGVVWRPGHVCLGQAAPVCRWCGRPQADPLTVYDVEFVGTWGEMAQTHAPDCRWIRTRGGQVEPLQEEHGE